MNKKWWKCAGIRALKTVCQTAAATIGTAAMLSGVDWYAVVSASLLAGVLSLLTSLAGLPEVQTVQEEKEDAGFQVVHSEPVAYEPEEEGEVVE